MVAAVVSVMVEVVRVGWRRGNGKSNSQSLSKGMGITTMAWAATAFVVAFVAAIYTNTRKHRLRKTCSFVDEPGKKYICTRELVACEFQPEMSWFRGDEREAVCEETVSPLFAEMMDGS